VLESGSNRIREFNVKFLGRLLLVLIIVVIGGAAYVVVTLFDDAPEIAGGNVLSPSDLTQAREFFARANPTNLPAGSVTALTIREEDLQLALNYALDHYRGGRAEVDIVEGIATMKVSMRMPFNVLGDYLNAEFSMAQWADTLEVQTLRLGGVRVPGVLADNAIALAHEQLLVRVPEYAAAINAINGYQIGNGVVNVVYQWQPEVLDQITERGRDLLVAPEDRERLLAHARNLATLTNDPAMPRTTSLLSIMAPMFHFAQLRGGDPVAENRAAILAMAMHVQGINVGRFLGETEAALPRAGRHQFVLSERRDFAQHFLISAGLTTAASVGLSDTIGLLKELEDAQSGGSGFSFTDLGADRTGVRLAELAASNPANAAAVQQMLASATDESVFMAEFRDLPEFMPEEEFRQRFQSIGSAPYNDVVADIERRIGATPLFASIR
jgi:hypothetical protein